MTKDDVQAVLNQIDFLRDCDIPSEYISCQHFRSGQFVHDQPDGYPAIGIVASGIVDVYAIALDGKEVQLNALTAGECFGIYNLLTPAEMETVLRCREETDVLFLPKDILIASLRADANLALRYAAYCNQKLQFLLQRIERLTMQTARGKLIEYLLARQDERQRVQADCSREDLASRIGVSRSALFRELAYLKRQGVLHPDGSAWIIADRAALEQFLTGSMTGMVPGRNSDKEDC